MKNYLKIILVILIAVCVALSMYFVADKNIKNNAVAQSQTTVTKVAATEKSGNKKLLTELVEEDYHLYKQDNNIILAHNGKEYSFENWSDYIDLEEPEMQLIPLDNDEALEVVVKVLADVSQDTGEKQYEIYVLNEAVDEDTGDDYYFVTLISHSTWTTLVNERVKIEISQLPSCDKVIQIALCMQNDSLNYDRDTGIADGFNYWCEALKDENGRYLQIDSWSKGNASFVIESSGIKLYIPLIATYKNCDQKQLAGYIKCTIKETADYNVYIRDHSMSFLAMDEYDLHTPKKIAKEPWRYVEYNTNKGVYSGGDKVINSISYKTAYEYDVESKSNNFATNDTELNALSEIKITESYVDLVAKSGYTFDEDIINKRKFKIIATDPTKPDRTFDMAYDAKIIKDKNGNQVARINMFKKAPRENLDSFSIEFGVE